MGNKITTIAGQSIDSYADYKEGASQAQIEAFIASAKIPLAGKYNASDETMETRSVLLSELGGGGGGGGVSPIVTTEITPVLENDKYTITLPNNNAYYVVSNLQGNAEIKLPTIGATENYNIVLFINSDIGDNKQILVYGESESGDVYDVHAMSSTTENGYMYGMGLVQFVFLGRGYTMTGKPTEWS